MKRAAEWTAGLRSRVATNFALTLRVGRSHSRNIFRTPNPVSVSTVPKSKTFISDEKWPAVYAERGHLRIVFLDRPVSRAMSGNDFWSRKYSRLIFPKIFMVITFLLLPKI